MSQPNQPVKEEAQRQLVILIFSTIGTVVTVYIVYQLSRPDAFRTLKMRAALALRKLSESQVRWWQKRADNATTMYYEETL